MVLYSNVEDLNPANLTASMNPLALSAHALTVSIKNLTDAVNNLAAGVYHHSAITQANLNHAGTQVDYATIQATLNTIQTYVSNGPMRVANAAAGTCGDLRDANGLIPTVFVHTRDALFDATVDETDALASHLAQHDYPYNGTVEQKRQFIADYLGCAI